ncbi:hypothetical protein CARUB_v10003601mg [Capsella rubella]|uniref:F-box domain-containing protein n=1 Tax=Capsella rubella TaxID=81985 RepID=R0HCV4_9BRAS|nr:putative F-box only protein 15 [Capsella rubella]EOA22870.1 hypothetical protein CARUB_v10003601mg [Capsella rubella]
MSSSKRLSRWLPHELIEEILIRTHVKSLHRFKSTCKQWYDLISDKRFMYDHLDRSPQRLIRIDNHQTVQIIDPVTGIISDSPVPDMFRSPYSIAFMVHCDGLMLCMCYQTGIHLGVWNPVTRKIKWVEPLDSYTDTDYFGIGYGNTCRDNYKILRLSGPLSFEDPAQYEIYEFKSDSWRTLDASKFIYFVVDTQGRGMSVKGNMYWIAENENRQYCILSFDFSMETFKNVCVCPPLRGNRPLGCFSGDRLSLLLQHVQPDDFEVPTDIEVWVTNKLSDGVVSFTKYFNVTSPHLPLLLSHTDMARPGYAIGNHKNIMAWCDIYLEEDGEWYTCITLYHIDQGGIRKQIETGRYADVSTRYYDQFICSYVYVPSSVSVPE